MITRFNYRIWGLGVFLVISILTFYHSGHDSIGQAWPKLDRGIPNIVHLVYVLPDPNADFTFKFKHFLMVAAVWHYWRPKAIYLHTNANPDAISRARSGASGKWNELIVNHPRIHLNYVPTPTHAGNGVDIEIMEHKSDFVRVKVVREFGGIYLDFDAYPLRDIRVLRKAGFNAVGGAQGGGFLNSGTFMSKKEGKMISAWHREMHRVYDKGWVTHSNTAMTSIGAELVTEAGEMHILEQQSWAPGSAAPEDWDRLFDNHDDAPNALEEDASQYREKEYTKSRDNPNGNPSWAIGWSRTYILHAFKQRNDHVILESGKQEYITPRSVLERRSNFARALYPVARALQDQGVITPDDDPL